MDHPLVDKRLRELAYALAGGTPAHLGMPTLPPISWAQTGDLVIVVLADGRKVSASIQDINALMFTQDVASVPPVILSHVPLSVDHDEIGLSKPIQPPAKSTSTNKGGKKKNNSRPSRPSR